jgi:curved DNA-binding protein CbpA
MDIDRFFQILELDRGATLDEAKQAYKDIVSVWHPDRFSNNPRLKRRAERKLQEVNLAYEMVKSFLSSNEKAGPEQRKIPKRRARSEDRTEVAVEAATRIILTVCSYLYTTLRSFVVSQMPSPDEEERNRGEPGGPNLKQTQGQANIRGRGRRKSRADNGR